MTTAITTAKAVGGAAVALAGGGTLAALTATPASAHEVSIRLGDVVGTVGENHSGIRVCELGPGVGWIQWHTGRGNLGATAVDDFCHSLQEGDRGGIVDFRVGWDQGGGVLWSGWKRA